MSPLKQNEQVRQEILSGTNPDKQKLIDQLIASEGFGAMEFIQSLFLVDTFHKNPENKNLVSAAAYGVKKLLKLRAIESVDEFKYCPYCKSPLHQYKIADLYAVGLKCSNSHKFHIEIQQNEFYEKKLSVNKGNSIEIAKEWLTNEDYRKNIQSQVAEILRKYVELNEVENKSDEQMVSNHYCPVCGLSLKKFEQDDVWVEGLECANGHVFYSRNGLNYENSILKPDINETTLKSLIDSYLSSDQKEHLPEQIIYLFNTIKETLDKK